MGSFFGFFLSWWGAFLLAALDSSLVFFLPFGIDAIVIYLAARSRNLFWMYPLIATAGSLTGAALTFWVGGRIGEMGLERWVSSRRLERIRDRVRTRGAVALAVPALMPPPFPLTPFILTCGALKVDKWRFFGTLAGVRLLRFGVESLLAWQYGRGIIRVLESDAFRMVIVGFIVVALIGTTVSAVMLWRNSRTEQLRPA